jgi:hypothetical protein
MYEKGRKAKYRNEKDRNKIPKEKMISIDYSERRNAKIYTE